MTITIGDLVVNPAAGDSVGVLQDLKPVTGVTTGYVVLAFVQCATWRYSCDARNLRPLEDFSCAS